MNDPGISPPGVSWEAETQPEGPLWTRSRNPLPWRLTARVPICQKFTPTWDPRARLEHGLVLNTYGSGVFTALPGDPAGVREGLNPTYLVTRRCLGRCLLIHSSQVHMISLIRMTATFPVSRVLLCYLIVPLTMQHCKGWFHR